MFGPGSPCWAALGWRDCDKLQCIVPSPAQPSPAPAELKWVKKKKGGYWTWSQQLGCGSPRPPGGTAPVPAPSQDGRSRASHCNIIMSTLGQLTLIASLNNIFQTFTFVSFTIIVSMRPIPECPLVLPFPLRGIIGGSAVREGTAGVILTIISCHTELCIPVWLTL